MLSSQKALCTQQSSAVVRRGGEKGGQYACPYTLLGATHLKFIVLDKAIAIYIHCFNQFTHLHF